MKITTPAFLFSAISLLMSAYIVRFSKLAFLIRSLSKRDKNEHTKKQIIILKKRLRYVRYIQIFSVLSLLTAVLTIFLILLEITVLVKSVFLLSLILFILSLIFAMIELYNSTLALELDLKE